MVSIIVWVLGITSLIWVSAAVMSVGILGRAFALELLWAWYVVPIFGVEQISLPMAAGLVTITYVLYPGNKHAPKVKKTDKDEDKGSSTNLTDSIRGTLYAIFSEAMVPFIAITIGWLFKLALGGT